MWFFVVSTLGFITLFSVLTEGYVHHLGRDRYGKFQLLPRRLVVADSMDQNHTQVTSLYYICSSFVCSFWSITQMSLPLYPFHTPIFQSSNPLVPNNGFEQTKKMYEHQHEVVAVATTPGATVLNYIIGVGNLQDSDANPSQCSTTATLSTCNVRSAWALCLSTIAALPCTARPGTEGLPTSCKVVLPANSISTIKGAQYGGRNPNVVVLLSYPLGNCNTEQYPVNSGQFPVSLSMTSASSAGVATIVGDGSATRFLATFGGISNSVSLSISNVNINGFGNGAVFAQSLGSLSFSNVGFMNNNGRSAVVLTNVVSSVSITNCSFVGNRASLGGGFYIGTCNDVTIVGTSFINNSAVQNGVGGIYLETSTNITISKSVFVGNNGTGLFVLKSSFLIIDECTFRYNSAGQGSAIYMSGSSNIGMTSSRFEGNVGSSALYIDGSCSLISIGGTQPVTLTALYELTQVITPTVITAPTGFRAVKFYTVLDADGYRPSGNLNGNLANDIITIGDFNNLSSTYLSKDFGAGLPGITGNPPYICHGRKISAWLIKSDPSASITVYIFPSVVRSDGKSAGVSFVGNSGGALYVNTTGSQVFFFDVTFDRNVGNVGAVSIQQGNRYFYFYNVVFKNNSNTAITNTVIGSPGGGAINIALGNSNFQFYDCSFLHNSAMYGGAVYLGSGNAELFSTHQQSVGNNILFVNIVADGNTAQAHGGWLFSHLLNGVIIYNSSITNNIAKESGGAVYLAEKNILYLGLYYSPFASSSRYYNAYSYSTIMHNNVVFIGNHAGKDGGTIYSGQENFISNCDSIAGCQGRLMFVNNACGNQGAGIAAFGDSTVTLGHTMFDSQHASGFGGAIALSASTLYLNIFTVATEYEYFYKPLADGYVPGSSIIMTNNRATSGSALYLVLSSIAYVNGSIHLSNNECDGHGGTIYWNANNNIGFANIDNFGYNPNYLVNAEALSSVTLPTYGPNAFNSVRFKNNILPAGMFDIATQTTQVSSNLNGTIVNITTYGTNLRPAPAFSLLDYYGNLNVTDSSSIVSWSILSFSCNKQTGKFTPP